MPNSHCFYFVFNSQILPRTKLSCSATRSRSPWNWRSLFLADKKLDQWVLPEVDQLRHATIQNQHSLTTRITSKCTTINSHFTNMTLCVPSFAICHHLRQPAAGAASGSSASAPTRVSFCAAQRNRARKCARFYLIIGN